MFRVFGLKFLVLLLPFFFSFFLFFYLVFWPPFSTFHEIDGERMFVRSFYAVLYTKPTIVQYLARKGLADVSDVERERRRAKVQV